MDWAAVDEYEDACYRSPGFQTTCMTRVKISPEFSPAPHVARAHCVEVLLRLPDSSETSHTWWFLYAVKSGSLAS